MNASHLRELMALGIVGDVLVRVAEIIDEASTASVDKSEDILGGPLESTAEQRRKERDKQRKRAERAAEKAAKLSALPSEDASSDCPSASTEGNKNRSLQEEKKELKKVSKKGSRLLIGARLSDENRAVAIECGCPPDRVDKVWTEFVDYWSDLPGQKGCKLSWTGTWRNRVKFIFERTGNGHGTDKVQSGGSLTASLRRDIAALEQSEGTDLALPVGRILRLSN